jgi:hypothetical protein
MVKPYRALLLLFYTGICLALITWFFPQEIPVYAGLSLKSFSFSGIFLEEKVEYADITDIQQQFDSPDEKKALEGSTADTVAVADTLQSGEAFQGKKALRDSLTDEWARPSHLKEVFSDTLEGRFKIQYPEQQDTLLYAFFRALRQANREVVRVLHYGDSQIEGDRITSSLRYKLQNRFGGCGAGMLPLVDPLGNRTSVLIKSDGTWIRYKAFGPDYSKKAPNRHGVLGSYFKMNYTVAIEDTAQQSEGDTIPKKTILPKNGSRQQ